MKLISSVVSDFQFFKKNDILVKFQGEVGFHSFLDIGDLIKSEYVRSRLVVVLSMTFSFEMMMNLGRCCLAPVARLDGQLK